jgi:outer membrane protein TolC
VTGQLKVLPLLLSSVFALNAFAQTGVLTLDEYLDQVRKGSQLFQAAQLSADAAGERATEFKLLTRPNLIAGVNYAHSHADTGSTISGDDNTQKTYSLGIQETTDFGLSAQLTYGMTENLSNGGISAPGLTVQSSYVTAGPQLTLTQSLWRNWFGEEIKATKLQIAAAALAQRFAQSFQQTQILADAEQAYWGLALAREQVKSAKEVLALTEKSQSWSAKRERLQLADRSDLLQANAALLQRRLALQAAVDSEKAAQRRFNTGRGNDSDMVAENLSSFDATVIDRLQIPKRVDKRDDVKAAEQNKYATEATARLARQRNTPTINLTGGVGLNGRDVLTNEAFDKSLTGERPNYAIGLQANIPLDFGTQSDVRSGYQKEVVAADVLYQRRVFESERLWHELTTLFNDAVGRYRISVDLEKANKEKVDYERFRHDRGRTTLYQVILFENDYAQSQFDRIRAQADVLNAYAQLRTFGGGQ